MNSRWLRGALALALASGTLLAAGCGGESPPATPSAEVDASTEVANLSIEGMT